MTLPYLTIDPRLLVMLKFPSDTNRVVYEYALKVQRIISTINLSVKLVPGILV